MIKRNTKGQFVEGSTFEKVKTLLCTCFFCGKEFWPKNSTPRKFCSKDCKSKSHYRTGIIMKRGIDNKTWKYGCGEYFRKIARNLTESNKLGLITHHIDGNYKNNEMDNLAVMSRSEHSKLHWLQGDMGRSM